MTNDVTIDPKNDLPEGMPRSIRIGAFDYKVEMLSSDDSVHFEVGGDFNHYLLRIRVLEGHRPQRQAEILLHEVLHGVYQNVGLKDGAEEEDVVYKMAIGLLQVIRDNPEMLAYIDSAVRQGKP